jgi:hypothetical protein
MFEHWWIGWQLGKLRQKELLEAAARMRLAGRFRTAGSRRARGSGAAQLPASPPSATRFTLRARSGAPRTGRVAAPECR